MRRVDLRGRLKPRPDPTPDTEKPASGKTVALRRAAESMGIRDEWALTDVDFAGLETRLANFQIVFGTARLSAYAQLYGASAVRRVVVDSLSYLVDEEQQRADALRITMDAEARNIPPVQGITRSTRRAERERNSARDYWNHAQRGGRRRY